MASDFIARDTTKDSRTTGCGVNEQEWIKYSRICRGPIWKA